MVPDLNLPLYKYVFCTLLTGLNIFLKLKVLKAPVDWDTASHLYFAVLRSKKISFKHSYTPGIKYLLVRLYVLLGGLIKEKPYLFRIFSMISSSLIICLTVYNDRALSPVSILYYLMFVVILNSLWICYQTSASEFYESLLLVIMFTIWLTVPPAYGWFLQVVLFILLFAGFKLVDFIYSIPLLFFYRTFLWENPLFFAAGSAAVFFFLALTVRISLFRAKSYSGTRKVFGLKNLRYIYQNLDFGVILAFISLVNLYYAPLEWKIVQLAVLLVCFIQKSYLTYFFYPPAVVGFFIAIVCGTFSQVNPGFFAGLFIYLLFYCFKNIILKKNARRIDILSRKKQGSGNWSEVLNERDKQVSLLKKEIARDSRVYLWGSNVSLLLLAHLTHVEGTYYNHNHLIYWGKEKDKAAYALSVVEKSSPDFIIEAGVMNKMYFPVDKFEKKYHIIATIDDMRLFKKDTAKRVLN